jgi:hypothetical protein
LRKRRSSSSSSSRRRRRRRSKRRKCERRVHGSPWNALIVYKKLIGRSNLT